MLPIEEQAGGSPAAETADRPAVVRTGRGLTIAGTRITLYQILDYIEAGWPAEQIQYLHRLTDAQMADVLQYIESHRAEVEAEYRLVLRRAEEIRAYWEAHHRTSPAESAALPAQPDREELRAQLEAWKQRLSQKP